MKQKNKDYTNLILVIIFILGIILRLFSMSIFNIRQFQFDIGIEDNFNDSFYDKFFEFDRSALKINGHLEYILTIYSTGHLLDSNGNQGYHPPLNHIILASFMRVLDFFGADNKQKIEGLEIVPFIYGILIVFVAYKIMRECNMSKKSTILPISLIMFHPMFIYLSRLINNDELVILLTLVSILYLIKWSKEPTYKNTIILGLAIGLARYDENISSCYDTSTFICVFETY